MSRWTGTLLIGGAAAAAARVVRGKLQRTGIVHSRRRPASGRWVITVDCPPDRLADPQNWPEPLRRLQDDPELAVRIEIAPAPGDKGTEIAAVPTTGDGAAGDSSAAGTDAAGTGADGSGSAAARNRDAQDRSVRLALRQTEQLLETGEVLLIDPRPHGTRTTTPGGLLLDAAAKRSGEGGLL